MALPAKNVLLKNYIKRRIKMTGSNRGVICRNEFGRNIKRYYEKYKDHTAFCTNKFKKINQLNFVRQNFCIFHFTIFVFFLPVFRI